MEVLCRLRKDNMMKRFLRIVVAPLISLVVSSIAVLGVRAASDTKLEVFIDNYAVEDETISFFVNHNQEDASWLDLDQMDFYFGSKQLPKGNVTLLQDSSEKVTYRCVIDVSGSMSQDRIDLAKEIIKTIAKEKRPEDNVAITTMANDLLRSEYMTDQQEISERVSGILRTSEDTNLYYAIVEELKELETSTEVGHKRCLIIFSDGADEQATGITREEANKAVEDSHIPVFTVAFPKNENKTSDQEMAKILGSFARISSGGEHYYRPDFSQDEIPLIGRTIVQRMNNSLILTENIKEFDTNEVAHEFRCKMQTDDGHVEAMINLAESDVKIIREIQEELAETEAETEVETKETSESEVEESLEEVPQLIMGMKPVVLGGIVAGVIGILLIIGLLLWFKKRRDASEYDGNEDADDGIPDDDNSVITSVIPDMNSATAPIGSVGGGKTIGTEHSDSRKRFHVSLVKLGRGDDKKNTFKFDLSDSYRVGRSIGKSDLTFEDDQALSGHHCTFFVKDDGIYVKDENSHNGTFVNGVPVTGSYRLEKGDILIMGSNEYRITW